jgi:sugar phosphate isomerase/epimerase
MLETNMRLSCCAYSFRDALRSGNLTLEDLPALCRRIGCDGVELTSYYFPSTERAFLNAIKSRAHVEGVSISGTAIGSDFANPDAAQRAKHINMARDWIEHSVILGAPSMRVFAGGARVGQDEREAFDNVVSALRDCAVIAYDCGVTLALENHGGLTATADGALNLLRAVDSPGLRLNLDFGNFEHDCYDQFAKCAPYAVSTHAKPFTAGTANGERQFVDYRLVQNILAGAGYRGWIAVEYEEANATEGDVCAFVGRLAAEAGINRWRQPEGLPPS